MRVLAIRASKGMVISPGDPDSRSAGSFFKNPGLSAKQYEELANRAAARGLKVPSYPALSQQSKVSAAWLVENSGFHRRYQKGAVGISTKHALAIVNRGGATANDVIALRDEIQAKVEQIWGVRLQPEPVLLGSSCFRRATAGSANPAGTTFMSYGAFWWSLFLLVYVQPRRVSLPVILRNLVSSSCGTCSHSLFALRSMASEGG